MLVRMHYVRTFVLLPAAQAAVNGGRRVALRIEFDRPYRVVVGVRPAARRRPRRRQQWNVAAVARQQLIDQRPDMPGLPRQQNGLIGKSAAGEEEILQGACAHTHLYLLLQGRYVY